MKAQNGTSLARKDTALTLTQQTQLDDIQEVKSRSSEVVNTFCKKVS